jgi:glycosyltransferase involved in cell wall biosynthesis
MKALHLTPFVFQPGKKGGGERYVQQLVIALSDLGVNVTLVEAKNFFRFKVFKNEQQIEVFSNLFRLVRLAKDSDLIHVHQLNRETFTVAFIVSVFSKKPMILTDHGGSSRHFFRLFGRVRLRKVSAIAAVSPWSLNDVDPKSQVSQTRVLWGGGDHIGERISKSYNPTDFLFLGRLLPHKGAHIAVEALPDGRSLTIAGESLDQDYVAFLKHLAVGKNVTFLGSPPDEDLYALYSSAKFFLLPSVTDYKSKSFKRPELLGIVALESIYAGTPVIGSKVGGLGNLLVATNQLAVPPGDVSQWRLIMEQSVLKPIRLQDRGRYTWHETGKICKGLYEEILSK